MLNVHKASVGLVRHQPIHTGLHWCGESPHCQLLMEHTADVENVAADVSAMVIRGRGGNMCSEGKE